MKSKKIVLLKIAIALLLFTNCALLNAQVTVGADTAPNATLDVVAIPNYTGAEGIIAPNLAITVLDDNQAAYKEAQTGAIVYVNDVKGGSTHAKTINITKVGYYYFDGLVWQRMDGGSCITTNVIRGNLSAKTFDASDFFAQQTVLLQHSAQFAGNMQFPDLNSTTDVGKTVTVCNRSTVGTIQITLTMIDNATGSPYSATLPFPIAQHRARSFMWIGDAWIETTL